LKKLPFSYWQYFIFGTAFDCSSTNDGKASVEVIKERNRRLRLLSEERRYDFYNSMYNKTLRVLFEKKTNNNELKGYSSNYVRVKTTYKKQLVNNFSIVKIVEVGKNICSSKIVE